MPLPNVPNLERIASNIPLIHLSSHPLPTRLPATHNHLEKSSKDLAAITVIVIPNRSGSKSRAFSCAVRTVTNGRTNGSNGNTYSCGTLAA